MSLAYLAAMKSKDRSSWIGAVIIGPDREIRSTGYNGMPKLVFDDDPKRHERPEKYLFMEHAERNAIFQALNRPRDCTMYTNGIPCADCGRAIIQSGIRKVIYHKQWQEHVSHRWAESARRTLIMFNEAKVELNPYNGPIITKIKCQRDGKEFKL
jgi:dCMP deaminase